MPVAEFVPLYVLVPVLVARWLLTQLYIGPSNRVSHFAWAPTTKLASSLNDVKGARGTATIRTHNLARIRELSCFGLERRI